MTRKGLPISHSMNSIVLFAPKLLETLWNARGAAKFFVNYASTTG